MVVTMVDLKVGVLAVLKAVVTVDLKAKLLAVLWELSSDQL